MFRELHLYDFDGTLFKSPGPSDPRDTQWWKSLRSLTPPVVPHRPSDVHWCPTPLREARRSTLRQDVYAVLATGRGEQAFRRRVEHLLVTQSLRFDEVHLNPGESTPAYKAKLLARLLGRLPQVRRVVVWEDRLEYLELYASTAETYGVSVDAFHVHDVEQEPVRVRRCASTLRVASRCARASGTPILVLMDGRYPRKAFGGSLREITEANVGGAFPSSIFRARAVPEKASKVGSHMYYTASAHQQVTIRVASRYLKQAGVRKKLKQKTKALLGRKPKKKKKPVPQSKADKIFKQYLRDNPSGKFKNSEEDKQRYLALRGIQVKKPKKSLKDKFKGALEGLKIKSKGMAEALKEAPANTRKFIMDAEYRNKSLKAAGEAIDKMTPQIAKDLVNNLLGEAKGYKEFARNVVGVMNGNVKLRLDDPDNPGKKIWNRDALASLYGVGAYVAAGVGAALTGGLAAAGIAGTAYAFAASKTMHSIQRTIPNTAMDFANRHALESAKKRWQEAPEGSEEEAEAKRAYDDLTEKDRGVAKREKILDLQERMQKAVGSKSGITSGMETELEQLKEEYGDDKKFGKYLDSPEDLAAMPQNVKVKMQNDNADARKRGVRELADRAFLGWEWAEVFSFVGSEKGLLDKDWVASAAGGTNWLARRASEIGKAIAGVVTASDARFGGYYEATQAEMSDYVYRRRMFAAGFNDKDRKALEEYVESVVSSIAGHYKQGLSDADMKEILETDVEAAVDGSLVPEAEQKKMKKLMGQGESAKKKTKKKASEVFSPYVAGQGYYDEFSWL